MTSNVPLEPTDQGFTPDQTHKDDSRSLEPSNDWPVFLRESSGSTRYSIRPFVRSVVLRSGCSLRAGESGGDEETRTPDPLLAKEMLFQLSYVPLLFPTAVMVGVSGLEPETSALSGQCSNQLS